MCKGLAGVWSDVAGGHLCSVHLSSHHLPSVRWFCFHLAELPAAQLAPRSLSPPSIMFTFMSLLECVCLCVFIFHEETFISVSTHWYKIYEAATTFDKIKADIYDRWLFVGPGYEKLCPFIMVSPAHKFLCDVCMCVCMCLCVCLTVFARGCTVGKAIMGLHLHICSVPIPAGPQLLFEEVFHIWTRRTWAQWQAATTPRVTRQHVCVVDQNWEPLMAELKLKMCGLNPSGSTLNWKKKP